MAEINVVSAYNEVSPWSGDFHQRYVVLEKVVSRLLGTFVVNCLSFFTFFLLSVFLTGCVPVDLEMGGGGPCVMLTESQVQLQTRQFFSEHPEYLTSSESESRLYDEFKRVMSDPRNKHLSMYQILLLVHNKLRFLDDFQQNKISS